MVGRPPVDRGALGTARSFGILSTFPPTACGIATFSAALAAGLIAGGATVDVVRCNEVDEVEDPLVVASMGIGGPDASLAAVDALNRTDVAIVQHEYGIYGGRDGDEVLDVLDALTVPIVVVAHTVVRHPTDHQRSVLERVCDVADAVVVMTEHARRRLVEDFDVDASRVSVIPHGATTPPDGVGGAADRAPGDRLRLLTWGLLGPGKGIEWAIDAMAMLADVRPLPVVPHRRSDPSEGAGDRRRGVSRDAAASLLVDAGGALGDVRRVVSRPPRADPLDRQRRPRGPALRLG